MSLYYNDKESTQAIKKFLKPGTLNKLSDPKDKKLAERTDKDGAKVKVTPAKVLPIRGQEDILN